MRIPADTLSIACTRALSRLLAITISHRDGIMELSSESGINDVDWYIRPRMVSGRNVSISRQFITPFALYASLARVRDTRGNFRCRESIRSSCTTTCCIEIEQV